MCGISGVFSVVPLNPVAEQAGLERMRRSLQHRGPDGSGMKLFEHAALVHNRLAIIDLSTGEQPLLNRAGTICIAFNGEIYNYRELRTRYPDYPFRTQSDTEVILAIYESEGIAGFGKLRGMYAFSLWDTRTQTGLLVRDPVGIKPLFYSQRGGRLCFGSEAKAILAQQQHAQLDTDSLHHLLNFRYVAGNTSLFQGIQQVPPGTAISWRKGEYCQFEIEQAQLPLPKDLSEAMQSAVDRHMVADVPIGCYLSGGIDSAIVARLASARSALDSYTLDVGDDPNESRNAADTAQLLGIPNLQRPFHLDDPIALHRSLIRHLEAPKVNALQSAMLAEFVSGYTKVALSGLGGDELFYGYNAHRIMWLAMQAKRFAPGKTNTLFADALLRAWPPVPVWNERQRALAMISAMPNWSRVYGILRNVWDSPQMRGLLYGERMLDASPPDSFAWLEREFPDAGDPVESMQRFEFRHKMVNDLLWHEDRVSMRVGLEVRVPFLDWELVRFTGSQSRRELMPFGAGKSTLKEYARGILPSTILKRKKSGFQLNIREVFGTVLKPVIDEYLNDERLRRHRLFNPRFVQDVLRSRDQAGRRWHYFLLYLMAQTHMLLEEFDVA